MQIPGATSSATPQCQHCGRVHLSRCPDIKAIEYHPDGSIKRVEYFAPHDYIPVTTPNPITWPPPNDWTWTWTGGVGAGPFVDDSAAKSISA